MACSGSAVEAHGSCSGTQRKSGNPRFQIKRRTQFVSTRREKTTPEIKKRRINLPKYTPDAEVVFLFFFFSLFLNPCTTHARPSENSILGAVTELRERALPSFFFFFRVWIRAYKWRASSGDIESARLCTAFLIRLLTRAPWKGTAKRNPHSSTICFSERLTYWLNPEPLSL